MPRQNFLSLESFVEATETQAKQSLLSVPVFAANIKLIAENEKLQSFNPIDEYSTNHLPNPGLTCNHTETNRNRSVPM